MWKPQTIITLTRIGEPYIETLNRGLLLASADGWGCPRGTSPASLNRDLLLTLPSARILEWSVRKFRWFHLTMETFHLIIRPAFPLTTGIKYSSTLHHEQTWLHISGSFPRLFQRREGGGGLCHGWRGHRFGQWLPQSLEGFLVQLQYLALVVPFIWPRYDWGVHASVCRGLTHLTTIITWKKRAIVSM